MGVCDDALPFLDVGGSELRLSDGPVPIVGLFQVEMYVVTDENGQ